MGKVARMLHHRISLCKDDPAAGAPPTATAAARALALAADGSGAPEWVQLLPAGPEVVGRDGRAWRLSDPQALVRRTLDAKPEPVLHIDYEHASETRAPEGEPAPAAGWITALEARSDGIWAKVEWTERAGAMIEAREYRYLSPVFYFEPETGEIVGLLSAGLTNRPNLPLAALNRETAAASTTTTETQMTTKAIAKALGLQPEASAESIEEAVKALASRAENPPLEKFVPRADYDALKERAEKAENALDAERKAKTEADITAAVDAAVEEGKIAPATKEYYLAQCRTEGGLERFKEFVASAPKIAAASDSGLDGRKPGQGEGQLSEQEKAVCRNLGITEEAYLKQKGADNGAD